MSILQKLKKAIMKPTKNHYNYTIVQTTRLANSIDITLQCGCVIHYSFYNNNMYNAAYQQINECCKHYREHNELLDKE